MKLRSFTIQEIKNKAITRPIGYTEDLKAIAAEITDDSITVDTNSTGWKDFYNKYRPVSQSRGLGDTIEKITQATGIKSLVKSINKDCGCEARRQKLNEMISYDKNKL